MKLVNARIQMFKSIEDSEIFSIDQVTCLVGKNESGKTAILQALQKLNPVDSEYPDFVETEYPRRFVSTYRERQSSESDNVLTTEWEIESSDVTYFKEKIGIYPLKKQKITAEKGYDNIIRWKYALDEATIIKNLLAEAEISEDIRNKLQAIKTISELQDISSKDDEAINLKNLIDKRFPSGVDETITEYLNKRLPKMLYFGEYDKLPGKISMTQISQNKSKNALTRADHIFLALLGLANSDIYQIQQIAQSEQLIMELEAISNRLTDEILKYWSQNQHLDVRFRFDTAHSQDPPPFDTGQVFSTRINNRRHGATVNFNERSTGFIWFFSFLILFSQVKKIYENNVIILLDEPGLTLHGTAQKNLLKYINEKLALDHQVLYTTHSPFMLNTEEVYSIRTVEDVVKSDQPDQDKILGTKVGMKILSRDKDTLLPLQGIAGFDIAQSMFVGPYVLVVEGPSEAGYINWFSRVLATKKRSSLDLRWAVCPAEGAAKISSFVTLFKGRGLKIATLMDFHDGEKAMVNKLSESGLLEDGCLLKTVDFVSQKDADIEDLVGWSMVSDLIHRGMELPTANKIPDDKPKTSEVRVAKLIDEHMKNLPPHFSEYNHYTPVKSLVKIDMGDVDSIKGIEDALSRFEKLFKSLNTLVE